MNRTNRSTKAAQGQEKFGYTNPADMHMVGTNETGKNAVIYSRDSGAPAIKVVCTQGESYRFAMASLYRIAARFEEKAFEYDLRGRLNIDSDKVGNPVAYWEPADEPDMADLAVFDILQACAEKVGFNFEG